MSATVSPRLGTPGAIQAEFRAADFGDSRLTDRLQQIGRALGNAPSESIPSACESWASVKGTYRFCDNENVDPKEVLSAHGQAQRSRLTGVEELLLVSDTTHLTFPSHRSKEGLGEVGTDEMDLEGVKVHSTIGVLPTTGQMTGILDQQRTQRQRLDERYATMQEAVESLTVQAPIDGQVTSLNAELGQIIGAGTRVGQVDNIDRYDLRAQIDEFYIERVRHGQTATTEALGDTTRTLTIDRVYPEVEGGQFEVDLAFRGDAPLDLRRGQTVRLRLELGQPKEATLLARGGFYQSTGGNSAYVLTEDGESATRQSIRLGRQNPNYFEVLGGLEPGDKVITSSYDTFGDADRLSLE